MDQRTPTITLQMVELWHKTDTTPRLRGPSIDIWREKDSNNPAPSYEEFEDGSVQFYSGVNGHPCRNLCEFEKDLLEEFYVQCNMPVGDSYAPFQLPDGHWQTPGTQFQVPGGAQFHDPYAPFEIPSFVELEIWRQKLNTPGLDAWEAYVKDRQTKDQKEERDASIKDWMKLMHDMFWHKERHCRCKAKKKGMSGRDSTTSKEKFQEMVKDMVFGVRWTTLKVKFETLSNEQPVYEAFATGAAREQQYYQDVYIEEPNTPTSEPSEENTTADGTWESIETQLRVIEDEKLWEIFKMAEKRIKWPRSTAELQVWGGAEAELRKSVLDSGHTEFLKNISPEGFYVHDSELNEYEIELLNDQIQPLMPVEPPLTPSRYRRKPKKDAATRAAEVKTAKTSMHSFIQFFLKNPQMDNAAEDEYINNLLQETPRKRRAPRTTNASIDSSDPSAVQEEFIKRILERSSKSKKGAKAQTHSPSHEVADDDVFEDSPSGKVGGSPTTKEPGDEQVQQQCNDEILGAAIKKSKSHKRKSAGEGKGNGEDDEGMMASPPKKPRVRTPKTPKKAVATLDNSADAQNENAEDDTPSKLLVLADLAIEQHGNQTMAAPIRTPKTPAKRKSRAKTPAKTPDKTAAEETPSKQLNISSMTIEGDVEEIRAPVKVPKTPTKRKSRAKKATATPIQVDCTATPETPNPFAMAFQNAIDDTPNQQLKLGYMTLEDQDNDDTMDAPVETPTKPSKRKISAKKTATATVTPKKRKSPVKNGAIDESPTKKPKATHTNEDNRESDGFLDLIDPLLRENCWG